MRASCVMVTRNRRRFVPAAIGYFLGQDYADRELVIVDDGDDPVDDLVPADPRIHYLWLPEPITIGAKRNLGVGLATGEIVVHWDDDDWMAPWRLSYQVGELVRQRKDVVGLRRLIYLNLGTGETWEYECGLPRPWVLESTFCYRREFALTWPFPELNICSGTKWLMRTPNLTIGELPDSDFYVATIHQHNVSSKDTIDSWWRPIPQAEVEAMMR